MKKKFLLMSCFIVFAHVSGMSRKDRVVFNKLKKEITAALSQNVTQMNQNQFDTWKSAVSQKITQMKAINAPQAKTQADIFSGTFQTKQAARREEAPAPRRVVSAPRTEPRVLERRVVAPVPPVEVPRRVPSPRVRQPQVPRERTEAQALRGKLDVAYGKFLQSGSLQNVPQNTLRQLQKDIEAFRDLTGQNESYNDLYNAIITALVPQEIPVTRPRQRVAPPSREIKTTIIPMDAQSLGRFGFCPLFKSVIRRERIQPVATIFKDNKYQTEDITGDIPCLVNLGKRANVLRVAMQLQTISQIDLVTQFSKQYEQETKRKFGSAQCAGLSLRNALYIVDFALSGNVNYLKMIQNYKDAYAFLKQHNFKEWNTVAAVKQYLQTIMRSGRNVSQISVVSSALLFDSLLHQKPGFIKFVDSREYKEAQNLKKRIQEGLKKENFVHAFIVGNEEMVHPGSGLGHYYAIVIIKHKNQIQYIVLDTLKSTYHLRKGTHEFNRLLYLIDQFETGQSKIRLPHIAWDIGVKQEVLDLTKVKLRVGKETETVNLTEHTDIIMFEPLSDTIKEKRNKKERFVLARVETGTKPNYFDAENLHNAYKAKLTTPFPGREVTAVDNMMLNAPQGTRRPETFEAMIRLAKKIKRTDLIKNAMYNPLTNVPVATIDYYVLLPEDNAFEYLGSSETLFFGPGEVKKVMQMMPPKKGVSTQQSLDLENVKLNFDGQTKTVDLSKDTETFTQQSFQELIEEKRKKNKSFILARVETDTTASFFDAEMLNRYLETNNTNPLNRKVITKVDYFELKPNENEFRYLRSQDVQSVTRLRTLKNKYESWYRFLRHFPSSISAAMFNQIKSDWSRDRTDTRLKDWLDQTYPTFWDLYQQEERRRQEERQRLLRNR